MLFRKLLLLFFIGNLYHLSAQDVSLQAHQDIYIHSGTPSQTYDTDLELKVKKSSTGNNDREAFVSFVSSSLQNTSQYNQVVLKLTQSNNNDIGVFIQGVDADTNVDLHQLNWENKVDSKYISYGGVRHLNDLYFDVTTYVKEEIQASRNIVFRIYAKQSSSSTTSFFSSEVDESSLKPQLLFYEQKQLDVPLFQYKDITVAVTDDNGYYNNQSWESTVLDTTPTTQETLDIYGGWVSCHQYEATGYFRVEQVKGVWQMIDPLGNVFYTSGINSVTSGSATVTLPDDILDLGVNTMGSWSDEDISGIPYCPRLNALVNFKNVRTDKVAWNKDVLPVFEPDFESYFQEKMTSWLDSYKNDPWVVGYFMDNELKFTSDQLDSSLTLAVTDAQYQRANDFMTDRHGSNYSLSDITGQDRLDYIGIVADKYYSVVCNAIRQVDPNHLILGSRINGNVRYRIPVIEAAGKYIDVLSINYYREWEPQQQAIDLWSQYTDIPWFTSEFYTKANDSGLLNEDGAGWTVPSQVQRSSHYENWAIRSMQDPTCVGFHWFRYNDNNGSNKGILTEDKNTWYESLKSSFKKVNHNKYSLRAYNVRGYILDDCLELPILPFVEDDQDNEDQNTEQTNDQTNNDDNDSLDDDTSVVQASKDIYLVLGQSNTAGRGALEDQDMQDLDNVYLFNGTDWENATNPMNQYSPMRKDLSIQALSYAYTFGQTLHQVTSREVGLVVTARGGTGIYAWKKGSTTGYYNQVIEQVQKAIAVDGGVLRGILWHQGESNKNNVNYLSHLSELVNDLRTDLGVGQEVPFIAGELSRDREDHNDFNERLHGIADVIPNAFYVSSIGLHTTDLTHFDTTAQRILGRRYAAKVLNQIYKLEPLEFQTTVSKDTYIRGGDPYKDYNYGSESIMRIKELASGLSHVNTRRALMQFDLSLFPQQSVLLDADLYFTALAQSGIEQDSIVFHRYEDDNWQEDNLVPNNTVSFSSQVNTMFIQGDQNSAYQVTIGDYAKQEVLSDRLLSLGIKSVQEDEVQVKILSKENQQNIPYISMMYFIKTPVNDEDFLSDQQEDQEDVLSLDKVFLHQKDLQLQVLENPSQGIFNIYAPSLFKMGNASVDVRVYTIEGKLILEKKLPINQGYLTIDISHLNASIYYLKIENQEGLVKLSKL